MNFDEILSLKSSMLLLKRKWNRLPKFLRFYLVLLFIFGAFTFSYYMFIVSRKSLNDENGILTSDFVMIPPLNQHQNEIVNIKKDIRHDNHKESSNDEHTFITGEEFKLASYKQNEQQKFIQEAILHSWNGYYRYAWGRDMLKPITKKGHNWFGIGLTILDSLDTLIIAGLENEFRQALDWVQNDLTFDVNENVNCFEITIRALAGLLSAYHLSKEKVLLEKAIDLGNRLIHCFDSPSKSIPYSDVNLKSKLAETPSWSAGSSLSEVSSVQLEFRDLSYECNNKSFEKMSFETSKHIHDHVQKRNNYLLPMYINPYSGNLVPSTVTLGARADSYYEYLYKQYAQTNIEFLLEDYIRSISSIKEKLMKITKKELKLTYFGEILSTDPHSINPKMDHLVCFLSGTLVFGYYHEHLKKFKESGNSNETFIEHLKMSEDLARTCHYMYNLTETGLSPEIAYFGVNENEDEFYIKPRDTHNLLRPEFVESLFFLHHITEKQKYRDWGWQVFQAFQKYTRVNSGGYTTINDVRHPHNVKPRDLMESFWLAETLKYLYLLFMDDKKIIQKLLDNYIFNTEGHILPRRHK